MPHLRARLTIAVAAVTVGALLTLPAGAHEIVLQPTTFAGTPTVAVDGATATASGLAIFGGEQARTLAEDPVGDGQLEQAGAVTATDLVAVRISQPEPVADELLFQLDTAGAVPVADGTPEVVQYNWDLAVDGGAAAGGSNWTLKAMRSTFTKTQSTDAWASLNRCVLNEDGATTYTCTGVHTFDDVEFEESETGSRVRIFAPFDVLAITHGSTIDAWSRSGSPVWTGPSASGQLTLTDFFDGIGYHAPYQVPVGGVVHLTSGPVADPESDPESLDWSVEASVDEDGSFSGSIELAPEDTIVGIRACFSDNCAYHFADRG